MLGGQHECLLGGVPVFDGDSPLICVLLSLERVRLVCVPFPLFLWCETPSAGGPCQDLLQLFPLMYGVSERSNLKCLVCQAHVCIHDESDCD